MQVAAAGAGQSGIGKIFAEQPDFAGRIFPQIEAAFSALGPRITVREHPFAVFAERAVSVSPEFAD